MSVKLGLSERLKELRLRRNLRQEDVARELGISTRSYCRYEYGEREPTASLLVRIADFYDVTLDDLVGRADRP